MNQLIVSDVSAYVEENIGVFHQKKLDSLGRLSLSKVLARKNPYLFKAKHVLTSEEIVRGLVDAHISSNGETILATGWKVLPFLSMKKYMEGGSLVSQG